MGYLFNKFFKKYCSESQIMLWFLFLLTIILSLTPFFKIGFTTADEYEFYIRAQEGGLLTDAYWYARGAGRFYFLITKPLYHIPYLIDNFYFTKFIQYGTLLLSFVLFTIIIQKIFKQKELSILILLLLFSFLSVSQPFYFMPIISYPFFFTFSFSILLLSILFLLKYLETNKYKYLILSSFIFFLSLLFYETYLIFLFFVCIFILFQNVSKQGKQVFTKKLFYKEIIPFIAIGIIYVTTYFLYRQSLHENEIYNGTSFVADFNIRNFFKILWNYNLSALPTFTYHDSQNIIAANSLLETGHQYNFGYLLTHSKITSLVNAFLQGLLFFFLCHKMENRISWKKIVFTFFILILLTFSVHLLIAVSEKYNSSEWWSSHKGYVTTFYSYFFITSIICVIIYAGIKSCYKYKWLKNSFIIVATLFIFCVSIIIGYSNDHLSRDWERGQNCFKMVEEVLKIDVLDDLSEDAIIYSQDLKNVSSQMSQAIFLQLANWKNYIYIKTHKKWNICEKFPSFQEKFAENPQQDIYYFTYFDSPKTQDVLLVLSKINNESIKLEEGENLFNNATSNESKVYYYSANKDFIFQFVVPQYSEESIIMINNEIRNISNGINAIRIENDNKKNAVVSFTLKSDSPFLVKSFAVSNIGFVNEKSVYLYDY